jgi:hypothetical protein
VLINDKSCAYGGISAKIAAIIQRFGENGVFFWILGPFFVLNHLIFLNSMNISAKIAFIPHLSLFKRFPPVLIVVCREDLF